LISIFVNYKTVADICCNHINVEKAKSHVVTHNWLARGHRGMHAPWQCLAHFTPPPPRVTNNVVTRWRSEHCAMSLTPDVGTLQRWNTNVCGHGHLTTNPILSAIHLQGLKSNIYVHFQLLNKQLIGISFWKWNHQWRT
jgi:hypothetical protein